ncbi:PadR family transcriptional regulator [Deinococcus deserti]|uniref:Putative Transcriptional regulator, PadR-like family n=1 Tax=Deinococcus deserti (strain DSM 17065 / CIP 109153 / LMG 22923 / VCD115) TaxID=546414 RepID=C1CWB0_DEIDV|nr:PadR family transcriptional regulator [Deinococcus deserti]ACO46477.1 putative Transcriptional regulator, PadR-like family [Deinococcus deserti VCD115]
MPRSPNTSPHTRSVLEALLQSHPDPAYGYDLSKTTGLRSGTLYPILQRLHAQGYLEARWEESLHPGKPPRHVYTLTEQGTRLARELRETARTPPQLVRGALS